MLEAKKKISQLEAELAGLKEAGASEIQERQAGNEELTKSIAEAAEKIEKLSRKMMNGV